MTGSAPIGRAVAGVVASALLLAACSGDGVGGTRGPRSTSGTSVPVATAATTSTTGAPVASVAEDDRRPVVLDYSPTVSDLGALAFLGSHPDLELVAVTLPGTGESYCAPGVAHTRGVLEMLGSGDVPVACGPGDPITGWNAFPTSWRVESSEMDLPEAPANDPRPAPELIAAVARASTTPVEIVAVGPLTNLAVALQSDPGLVDHIAGITIMGGAVDVPGNVIRNAVGEWNIWVDPTAAGIVLAAGAPVTLVPLDATNDLPTSPIFYEALAAAAATPAAMMLRDLWTDRPDWYENADGWFYFWDELAAAVVVDETLVEFDTRTLVVDDATRENKGWTREDPAGSPVRVAVGADRLAFETLFLEIVGGGPADLGYVAVGPGEATYFADVAAIAARAEAAFEAEFTAAAAELDDVDLESELGWLELMRHALPALFDAGVAPGAAALASLDPPPAFAELHAAFAAGWESLVADRDELIVAVRSGAGSEALAARIGRVGEACLRLQREADLRLLEIDLACW